MMMTFLDEMTLDGVVTKFYEGIDIDKVIQHSDKGDDGFMIILIDSVQSEIRNQKINSLFKEDDQDIERLLNTLNNNYIAIYQSPVEHTLMVKILKDKFEKNQSNHWKPSGIKDNSKLV
jgi:hypothetical protein